LSASSKLEIQGALQGGRKRFLARTSHLARRTWHLESTIVFHF
jgi:hypothetical protein